MLYYGEDVNLTEYKTRGHARYKPNMGKGMTFMACYFDGDILLH